MKLYEFMNYEKFFYYRKIKSAKELFNNIAPQVLKDEKGKVILEKEQIIQQIFEREKISSTGIGNAIAIPHFRVVGLKDVECRFAYVKNGINFNAIDKKPSRFFFLFITPSEQTTTHLQILAKIAEILSNPGVRNRIEKAISPELIYKIFVDFEEKEKPGYRNLDRESIFEELITSKNGLTSEEARKRLSIHGYNILKKIKQIPLWIRFSKNLASLFAILLWIGGGMCFIPGVNMPQLGWAIFCVIIINAIFSFWQEFKAEKAVEALRRLIPQKSSVLRDGKKVELLSSELVPGDVVFFEEGDAIPIDARLIEANEMRVDNSTLTGESRPIYKMAEPLEAGVYLLWTELPNIVFAGTSVSSGSGAGVVIGTGMHTEIGKIAKLTQIIKKELSPLQKEMYKVVNIITCIAVGLGILFFFLGKLFGGLSYITAFIFTIGIIVANIPEGLLPTLSLSLAMGVQRMAKRNVLIKQLSSVETLGSTNVICTDKTGTLTTNQISICKIFVNNRLINVSGASYEPKGDFFDVDGKKMKMGFLNGDETLRMFFVSTILCNNASLIPPSEDSKYWKILGDPTEASLIVLARKAGVNIESIKKEYKRIGHLPFESIRKRMSTINQTIDSKKIAFVKGAPVETLENCDKILLNGKKEILTPEMRNEIVMKNDIFAREGLRVLAVTYREDEELSNLSEYTKENVERNLTFIALTGMADPPRPEVPEAIAKCKTAGIKIIMITGDYGLTAKSIAHKIGMIDDPEKVTVVTGHELLEIDHANLRDILKKDVIFARMTPDQKMRVVSCLKDEGYIVAVTGDGVNDAPALKKADLGIALGLRGSDVAKEASNMIITDDNFASIIVGIEEGRAIYTNIKKFITYIFASNVPEIIPFILFVTLKIPLPLTIMQILAIDLGTDLIPALGLGVETPEPGIMNRPPRSKKERLVDTKLFLRAYLFLGMIEAALCMVGYYFIYWKHGWRPGIEMASSGIVYTMATTMCLAGIVTSQIGNIFCCRTDRESVFKVGLFKNRLILLGIIYESTLISIIVYTSFFQRVFETTAIGIGEWLLLLIFAPIILAFEEIRKWIVRKYSSK